MSQHVLVINSGSSSIKYQLIDIDAEDAAATGVIERIGQETGAVTHTGPEGTTSLELPVPDHETGMDLVLRLFADHGPRLDPGALRAVGHRVVQGGDVFAEPAIIDDDTCATIEALSDLAPLHNPPNLAGIHAARKAFPATPHVAVFDTSFHQTLPAAAYTYAIDRDVAMRAKIRRYGFHGTSHKYVSELTAQLIGKPVESANVIVLHLGNGASATAVRGGRSVETSMGLTPLEGLVMGTRAGDIDAAVVFHLSRGAGMSTDEIDALLNRKSGILGLCGLTDMRDVHAAEKAGDEAAATALAVYYHRIKSYVGAYYAQLGHVDAIAFTAGIGENDAELRAKSLAGLERLGIAIDPARNATRSREPMTISPDGAEVTVLVVPTNEELEIAREAVALLG